MARGTQHADLDGRRRRWRDFRPSVWTFVAPVALAACAFVILSIARDAGWTQRGHTTTVAPTTGAGEATQRGGAILYRIKKGETLTTIALRFEIPVETLRTLNPKLPANGSIPAGRRIRLR